MKSSAEEKSVLRDRLLKARTSISVDKWAEKSLLAVKRLKGLSEFQTSGTIHCFVSMNQRREVNTHDLIRDMLLSDKEVIVPVTDFEKVKLTHTKISSFKELNPNKWGVLEPENSDSFDSKVDLIIVPLLAADISFNRLGYGKGFYDRFLSSNNAVKVGLLFDDFLLDEIPVEDFDEKLDILITDKKTLRRNNEDVIS